MLPKTNDAVEDDSVDSGSKRIKKKKKIKYASEDVDLGGKKLMNNDASRKVSKLVCYAQSTSAVISGRWEEEWKKLI